MSNTQFGQLVSISKGKKHELTDIPLLTSTRLIQIGDLRNDNVLKYTNDSTGVRAYEDDLLIAWDGANAGTVGWGLNGFAGSTIAVMRINDKAHWNTEFLGFLLQSQFDVLRGNATGATIPHLSRSSLENIRVPEFDLITQCRIAHVLTKAQNLTTTRRHTLANLDDLLKSSFYEFFGDPVRNEKGWNIERIGKVITDIVAGDSYGGEDRPFSENELGVLKISAVTSGTFKPTEFKAVSKAIIKKPVIFPKKGDLLFSRANTRELVGATCIVDKDYDNVFLPDKLWRIDINNDKCNSYYLKHLLSNERLRTKLTDTATGTNGSMLNISMEKLRNFQVPIPPPKLQSKFATVVERVESMKAQQRASLAGLQALYKSLLFAAFRGDLDLRRVDLTEPSKSESEEQQYLNFININTKEHGSQFEPLTAQNVVKWVASGLSFAELQQTFSNVSYTELREVVFQVLKDGQLRQKFNENTGELHLQIPLA